MGDWLNICGEFAGARFVLIVGDDELAAGRYSLKNMSTGAQESLALDEISARLAESRN